MTKIIQKLPQFLNFNESVTVVGFKGDGLKELVRKTLKSIDKKDIVFFEDIDSLDIAEGIIVVEDIDKDEDPVGLVETIDEICNNSSIKVLYVVDDVNIFGILEEELSADSSFFENTLIVPVSEKNEKETLSNYCEKKYGPIGSTQKLDEIFNQSGGHMDIFKALYKSEVTGIKQIFENYAKKLILSFDPEELKILRKVVKKIEINEEEERTIDIYKKLGFVEKNKITVPALKDFIVSMTPKEKIEYTDDGQIILTNIHEFSKTEIKVLKTLIENINEIVTKEELGFIVWGREVDQKYSPWAIDQIIFRLRNKLEKLNIYGEIKTIHGKGYIFQS